MRRRKRLVGGVAASVVLWGVLTLLVSLACADVWRRERAGAIEGEPRHGWLNTRAANVSLVANAPAWFVAWRVMPNYATFEAALLANGLGFGLWICGGWALWGVRRRWLDPRGHPVFGAAVETSDEATLTRRAFLTDLGLGCAVAGVAGSGVAGTLVTPWSIRVRRFEVPMADLPASLDGLRIVQLTDTHLGPRIPESHVAHAVQVAIEQRPDLVVLTGDYVNNNSDGLAERAAALFEPLVASGGATCGVVGVLGNHDHYADGPRVARAMRAVGVHMIDNDRVYLDAASRRLVDAPPETGLCIAGLGDLYEDEVNIRRALRDTPSDMPCVLLSHNPDVAEDIWYEPPYTSAVGTTERVDLMLAGHTHGGQVRLPLVGAPIVMSRHGSKYARGLVHAPGCTVIVSAGIGMSILPVRFGVPPEVVCVTLRRMA